MDNITNLNSNIYTKKLSRTTSKHSNNKSSSKKLQSSMPLRSKSNTPSRLNTTVNLKPSRIALKLLGQNNTISNDSKPKNTPKSIPKVAKPNNKTATSESRNEMLFDVNNIIYPYNNNLNEIKAEDINYKRHDTKLSNIAIQLSDDCLKWATKYHLASPYLFEMSTAKSSNNDNNINNDNNSGNHIYYKIYQGSINDVDVPRANTFHATILIVMMYTIYTVIVYYRKMNNETIQNYYTIIQFINSLNNFSLLKKIIDNKQYTLPDEYKLYYYNLFIKPSLYAYKTANDFYDLGGHVYISNFHGKPITYDIKDSFFKVPKNVKIGFLAPLGYYGIANKSSYNVYYLSRYIGLKNILTLGPHYYQNINNNVPLEFMNMNIYHEGQLVPNLSLSLSFDVVISDNKDLLNTDKYYYYTKYRDNTKIYRNNKIYFLNMSNYIYNKLIKFYIRNKSIPNATPNKYSNIFKGINLKTTTIYIDYDDINSFIENSMIINNVSMFHPDILDKLKNLNDDTVDTDIISIFKMIENMSKKTIKILSNFDVEIKKIDNKPNNNNNNSDNTIHYKFDLSISMNKYINIIDNELKNYNKDNTINKHIPGGNLYLFNSCRYYDDDIYNKIFTITSQLAMTYITNMTNKYVSSLINKKPDKVNYTPHTISIFNHSINSTIHNVINNNTIYNLLNKQYSSFVLDLSKDFLILFAISNIITNSKTINIDHTKNSDILRSIKIALYNLFIKPRFDFKELTPYTISNLKMYTQKTDPVIKPNNIYNINRKKRKILKYPNSKKNVLIVNEINSILYSKIKPSLGYLEVLFNNIAYFLIQYYLPYIKWIYNNYVLIIHKIKINNNFDNNDNNNTDMIKNKILKYYPLLYVPIHNYFNHSKRKHKTKPTTHAYEQSLHENEQLLHENEQSSHTLLPLNEYPTTNNSQINKIQINRRTAKESRNEEKERRRTRTRNRKPKGKGRRYK